MVQMPRPWVRVRIRSTAANTSAFPDERNTFFQKPRDVTELHILARLDAEQHLRYEPAKRLRQARTEFRGELRQLRFQSGSEFAIVHGGPAPEWFGFCRKNPSTTDSVPCHFDIP